MKIIKQELEFEECLKRTKHPTYYEDVVELTEIEVS